MSTIFIKDSFRAAVEAASGGHQTVLYNQAGYPGFYNVIPKFDYASIGLEAEMGAGTCTAFVVDAAGTEVDEIFIGSYLASMKDGYALPLPGMQPATYIDWDASKTASEVNGSGFHLMTAHEWAAIALWCTANSTVPRGNTDNGRAHDALYEIGRRWDGYLPGIGVGNRKTLTGSGPAAWRHNHAFNGIADLVGNVREWHHLFKLEDGQIFTLPYNDDASDDTDWAAQGVYFTVDGGVLALSDVETAGDTLTVDRVDWDDGTSFTSSLNNELLKRLLIEPYGTDVVQGHIYVNNAGSRFLNRGGNFRNAGEAGLAFANLCNERSFTISYIGFRPACILPG